MKGIVVYSFGLRPNPQESEPNPCNIRLARAVARYYEPGDRVVAQWEVARALQDLGIPVERTVSRPNARGYLGSEQVWDEARPLLRGLPILPIAQRGLHLFKVKRLMQGDNVKLIHRPIGPIGFDGKSEQWYTRGPLRLFIYAVLQGTIGLHGPHRHPRRSSPA